MDRQPQRHPDMEKLASLVEQTAIGMLTTLEPDGSLRSRPLVTVRLDSGGRLWFLTSISSPKVAEIDQHRQVNVSYADPKAQSFVSVSGTTQILRDRERIRELWTPEVEPWFPQGAEDPDLALLAVTIESAEYWDAPSRGMVRILGPGPTSEHAKVTPRPHA